MKKRIILSSIVILVLSFIFHSAYKLIPSFITSIFFPVNESIWEHGKMTLSSFFVLTIIEKFLLKDETNTIYINFLASIICIVLTYILFTPIFLYILKTNDNLVITIIVYIICIITSIFIKEKYLKNEKNPYKERLSILGIMLIYIIYTFFTYNPLKKPIFYDYNENIYGIKSSTD